MCLKEAVDETIQEFGHLDILLSNAGTLIVESVRDMSRKGFEQIMDLNVTVSFLMTKYSLPHLEKTKGNILYISSVAGCTNTSYIDLILLKCIFEHVCRSKALP